jgi:hypothetical protein
VWTRYKYKCRKAQTGTEMRSSEISSGSRWLRKMVAAAGDVDRTGPGPGHVAETPGKPALTEHALLPEDLREARSAGDYRDMNDKHLTIGARHR